MNTSTVEATDTPPEPVPSTRSPRALGRLLSYSLGAVLVVVLVHLLDRSALGLRTDARQAAEHLPGATGGVLDALALTAGIAGVLAGAVEAWFRRWRRFLVTGLLTPVVVGAIGFAVADRSHGRWAPAGAGDALIAGALAGAAAGLVLMRIGSPGRWQRALGTGFALSALAGGAWVNESIPGRVVVLALGATLGSLVALIVGTPSRRATAASLTEAMAAIGLPVSSLSPVGADARGSTPWSARLETGSQVFVKTFSDEERIADLLFRLWRGLRLRDSGDARPHASLLHAVEHEAFAATRAAAVGARVPRVLALGAVPGGGVFAVHEAVDGRSLDQVVEDEGADAVSDATLREAWSMIRTLHRAGIAHRDLRASNLVLDAEGQVWIVDFAFSDLLADEALKQRDLVEHLAATAALVGPERAIDAAVATLGDVEWRGTLPLVQPLAVSSATRAAHGRTGFAELRERLARAVEAPSPDLPRLARVDRRTIFTLAALTVAVWALLPQVAQSDDLWSQIPAADRTLLLLAALASVLTYLGATASLLGAVPEELPPGRTLLAQLASSFTNRVTPAKVGGLALNVRWLIKQGVPTPVAAAGISANAVAGFIMHVALTLFAIVWAGKVGLGDVSLPSPSTIGLGVGLIAAVAVVSYLIPPLRDLVTRRVVPRARQSVEAARKVVTQPRQLALLFGGSAFVTVCYVAALTLSLRAVGADAPVSTVALVYLAGGALASAAPTPGGLGATEAVFVAALTSTGIANDEALAAVLLYRFVTFWLPILPGYLAFSLLQRKGEL